MTRRRVLYALLLSSVLLLGLGCWLVMASRSSRITRARFEQVEKGMSREEVIRTVGGPPGDYTSEGRNPIFLHRRPDNYCLWFCDDGRLIVLFDDADNVESFSVSKFDPPTPTELIRIWLGL